MATYRYVLAQTSDGKPLAEVPFVGVTYENRLSDVGVFTGALPTDHPKARAELLRPGSREVTVIRDGVPVWNGPVTIVTASLRGQVQVQAQTFPWLLHKRTVDVNRVYARDVYDAVRDLIALGTTGKQYGAISRFAVTAGLRGVTKTLPVYAIDRRAVLDVIRDFADDRVGGFDWFAAYGTDPASGWTTRTFTLAAPAGATVSNRVLQDALGADYHVQVTEDLTRAANRVSIAGGGYTATQDNTASLTGGDPLLEHTARFPDLGSHSILDGIASHYLHLLAPPVRVYTVGYRPSPALPYGWCALGDTVRLREPDGYLSTYASIRVVALAVSVDAQHDEVVTVTGNDPTTGVK